VGGITVNTADGALLIGDLHSRRIFRLSAGGLLRYCIYCVHTLLYSYSVRGLLSAVAGSGASLFHEHDGDTGRGDTVQLLSSPSSSPSSPPPSSPRKRGVNMKTAGSSVKTAGSGGSTDLSAMTSPGAAADGAAAAFEDGPADVVSGLQV
jgi:hypothetical protein